MHVYSVCGMYVFMCVNDYVQFDLPYFLVLVAIVQMVCSLFYLLTLLLLYQCSS